MSSEALVKRAADDVALMPPPPIKKIKRPPKVLDEDDYTDALSDIIARDYFPGLRESQAQQEYLAALDSNNDAWIAEAAQKLREASNPARKSQAKPEARDGRCDTPSATPSPARAADTPIGQDGSETPASTTSTEPPAGSDEPERLDTNPLSQTNFQTTYTSEDNASFNDVLDKQNLTRRKKHAYLWTPDQRLPSKRLLLHRAKEQQLLTENAHDSTIAKNEGRELVPLTHGATDARPAKPDAWKSQSPTNNFMFNVPSVDEEGLPTQWQEKERNSKAGPRQVIHENTRFPPLQYIDDDPPRRVPQSPSLNTDIINRREAASETEYPGGDTPRVNGYAFVDEDEPEQIPQQQETGPSYRDLLAGQVGDATPNPFKLSVGQKREELHYRMVEETNRKKRVKELETRKEPSAGEARGKEAGNMTPAAWKLMDRLGKTPVRQPVERMGSGEMWTPVRTPRRVK